MNIHHHKLSVIVLTKNEENNIFSCLNSLDFSDEIILIDSGSTDNTINIARQFSNVKIYETEWLGFSKTKELGVNKVSGDWILWIDADEVVTDDLKQEWSKFSNTNDMSRIGAISISRKTFFLRHFIKHSGWYPENIVRFFHKDRAIFNGKILHEGLEVNSNFTTHQFSSSILHYSYTSLSQYFSKMNQYGYLGAQELIRKKRNISLIMIILSPLWAFIKNFLFKKGFLDGFLGLVICIGAAFANFIKYTNYFFLKRYGYVKNTHKQNR